MNGPHLHLLLNHFPIVGAFLGLILWGYALWRKDRAVQTLGLMFFALIGLMAMGAFFTGEPAEEGVEHLPGVSEQAIEAHEDAAGAALGASLLLGLWSAGCAFRLRTRPAYPRFVLVATLLLLLVTAGLMGRAGNLGGRIRHPEIHDGAGAVQSQPADDQRGRGRGRD